MNTDNLFFNSKSKEGRELSNFYIVTFPVVLKTGTFLFSSAESAYQCLKQQRLTKSKIATFQIAEPAAAREYGKTVPLRKDWEDIKVDAMRHVLEAKFSVPEMRDYLLSTGDKQLVHFSPWDTFWGVGKDGGSNVLGTLLMEIRRNQS